MTSSDSYLPYCMQFIVFYALYTLHNVFCIVLFSFYSMLFINCCHASCYMHNVLYIFVSAFNFWHIGLFICSRQLSFLSYIVMIIFFFGGGGNSNSEVFLSHPVCIDELYLRTSCKKI